MLAVGEHGAGAAGGEGCGAADGGEEANGHFVGDDGASVDEPGEGSLVFVVAVADDFAVALVGDTALVGAVPGPAWRMICGTVTGISGKGLLALTSSLSRIVRACALSPVIAGWVCRMRF